MWKHIVFVNLGPIRTQVLLLGWAREEVMDGHDS